MTDWNPLHAYWRVFGEWDEGHHDTWSDIIATRDGRPLDRFLLVHNSRREIRHAAVRRWSWAVPSPETLDVIAACGPIIEIGAGTGYWARLLRDRGVDVIATDADPVPLVRDHVPSTFKPGDDYRFETIPVRSGRGFHPGATSWTRVEKMLSVDAAAAHPDRTLLLVWPPPGDEHAADAVDAYLNAGGRRVIYVGENGGVTGTPRLEATIGLEPWCSGCEYGDDDHAPWCGLPERMTVVGRIDVPNWPDIHDSLYLCEVSHTLLRSGS